MAITANCITGPHTILLRYTTMLHGLKLEAKCPGMQLTRGPKMRTRVIDEFAGETELLKKLGIKLNRSTKADVLIKLVEAKIDAVRVAADAIEAVK